MAFGSYEYGVNGGSRWPSIFPVDETIRNYDGTYQYYPRRDCIS